MVDLQFNCSFIIKESILKIFVFCELPHSKKPTYVEKSGILLHRYAIIKESIGEVEKMRMDAWLTQWIEQWNQTWAKIKQQQRKNPEDPLRRDSFFAAVAKYGYYTFPLLSSKPIYVTKHNYIEHYREKKLYHNHSYFELVYVYRGSCVQNISNQAITMSEGDAMLLNPHALHWIYITDPNDIVFNVMISKEVFENSLLALLSDNQLLSNFFLDYFYQLNKIDDSIYFPFLPQYSIQHLIQQLAEESLTDQLGSNTIMKALCLQIFTYLAREYQHYYEATQEDLFVDRIALDMIHYIQENLQTVSLKRIAEKFNYSQTHISRLLKKSFHKGYLELIQNIRLQTAKDLLENTQFTMEEISNQVGVYDVSYLYKIFKKKYGLSPVQYRKEKANPK